jgi:hypothetical protein
MQYVPINLFETLLKDMIKCYFVIIIKFRVTSNYFFHCVLKRTVGFYLYLIASFINTAIEYECNEFICYFHVMCFF